MVSGTDTVSTKTTEPRRRRAGQRMQSKQQRHELLLTTTPLIQTYIQLFKKNISNETCYNIITQNTILLLLLRENGNKFTQKEKKNKSVFSRTLHTPRES